VHGVNYVRQTEIHTAELPVPEPSVFEFEMAVEKLKRRKSPGIDQTPAEFFKAGDSCEFRKLIYSIWNKEEFLEEWKESIVAPIYKSVKTDFSNCRGISLFSTAYKICPNILLSGLTPCAEGIIGDHQCGFSLSLVSC
jgi:hypothetical protein